MALSQRRAQLVGRLRRRKTRTREGLVLVEGVRAVREALEAGAEVRFAVVSPSLEGGDGGAGLREGFRAAGVELHDVDDAELAGLADTQHPQGVLAVCQEPRASDDAIRAGGRYLVLDAVQDPGNVGTLVRAATAFALDAVLVLDGSADPWSAKAVRAAAGMSFRLPVLTRSAEDAVALLSEGGVPILVADPSAVDVSDRPAPDGWALVVGNEGRGPRESVRDAAVRMVAVHMPGPAESLNAGVAGSILLYALTREDAGA